MEFGFACRAEIIRFQRISCTGEIFQGVAGLQARESEMRRVSARFSREAKWFERLLDGRSECSEIGSGLDSAPQHARLEFVRKETENAEIHGHGLRGTNRRERGAYFGKFLRIRFA